MIDAHPAPEQQQPHPAKYPQFYCWSWHQMEYLLGQFESGVLILFPTSFLHMTVFSMPEQYEKMTSPWLSVSIALQQLNISMLSILLVIFKTQIHINCYGEN